ncbi:hypothetical protein ACFO0S_04075 [Chryseomicrobium palamuruense]|uniref:Uncharacterized protein n=1 Tax=Chryseomicrobium palamuruense TaxID=682973 RepID=A0ABV8UT79_9BACL
MEIIEILLDHDLLKFSREDLLDGEVFSKNMRDARLLETRYLSQEFETGQKVEVIRVLDSPKERYHIQHPYDEKIEGDIIGCYTRPEIEILLIIAEGHYSQFKKTHLKPNEYCKQYIPKFIPRKVKIKIKGFITSYFSNPQTLVQTLQFYHQIRANKNELTIYSLLK